MNELLGHLAGSQQTLGELAPGVGSPPIRWRLHPDELAGDDQLIDDSQEIGRSATRS